MDADHAVHGQLEERLTIGRREGAVQGAEDAGDLLPQQRLRRATEYELFDAGKSLERFSCSVDVKFTTSVRDIDPPEDGPDIYDFVSQFMREQDAFVPACSFHLNTGWMTAGQKVDVAPQVVELLPKEAFERVDFVAVGG
jgi:hypothetical protein